MSRAEVVVVGGGLAGIAAALDAADAGAGVTLLERRGKLGGLTWSFQRKGRWFDNGQHVFLRCCTAYREFLERIGATSMTHLQPRLEVPVLAPGGRTSVISRSSLPAPLHLLGSLARYRHLTLADRARLARPALGLRRLDLDDPALDDRTFGSWLAERGQRPAAIAALWNLIALPTLNVSADEASLALAAMVFRTGLLDRAEAGDIGWSSVPLGELHGEQAAKALDEAGVEVHLAAVVDALETSGPRRVLRAGGRSYAADAVIVTTPPEVSAGLLGDGVLGPVARLGASPIVNVHLVLDRKVTDLAMFACVESSVQFVFDRTGSAHFGSAAAATGEQCLSISLSGAEADVGRRPEDLISSYRDALGDVLPAVRDANLLDGVVSRERSATFRAVPGSASLRPSVTTSLDRVLVAGAWCDTGWPATMEGAVRSGSAAAAAALARIGSSELERVAS
ncbi:MAG: hydroxysqualene dehydroxylase HpnE [Acidimicrobiales bacterium]